MQLPKCYIYITYRIPFFRSTQDLQYAKEIMRISRKVVELYLFLVMYTFLACLIFKKA